MLALISVVVAEFGNETTPFASITNEASVEVAKDVGEDVAR